MLDISEPRSGYQLEIMIFAANTIPTQFEIFSLKYRKKTVQFLVGSMTESAIDATDSCSYSYVCGLCEPLSLAVVAATTATMMSRCDESFAATAITELCPYARDRAHRATTIREIHLKNFHLSHRSGGTHTQYYYVHTFTSTHTHIHTSRGARNCLH